uniref:GTP-binding protein 8 n=1 Tax=Myxine glutinosa TaxID=7769 RepID=UPI00358F281E
MWGGALASRTRLLPKAWRRTLGLEHGDKLSDALQLTSSDRLAHLYPLYALQENMSDMLAVEAKNDLKKLLFVPSEAELQQAEQLFVEPVGSARTHMAYVSSAERIDHAPKSTVPEVCFLGRSNVGKSSLLRAMFSLAPNVYVRVSKTPGHTKKLNFFRVGRSFLLVDAPGYGYRAPIDFTAMVSVYLKNRQSLKNVLLLIDSGVGIQPPDRAIISALENMNVSYTMVLTKSDRASRRDLLRSVLTVQQFIKKRTTGCFPEPLLVSSHTYAGISLLRCFIAHVTGTISNST